MGAPTPLDEAAPAGATAPPMRERILVAADRLFYHQGIGAVGVDALAAGAGISKRTLYKHFPSKDELVAAYLQRKATAVFTAAPGQPPADQVLAVFDALAPWFGHRHFRGCAFVNAVAELGGDRAHPAIAVVAAHKQRRREWFQQLLAPLAVADAALLADQLAILFEGAIAISLVRGGDPGAAHAAREAARALLEHAGVAPQKKS